MSQSQSPEPATRTVLWARLLLLIPFVAMLWVASYDSAGPTLAGIPFFYWYQLAWVLISAAIIGVVFVVEN